eukprot:3327422-Pyramimonas_sp.AAC.1
MRTAFRKKSQAVDLAWRVDASLGGQLIFDDRVGAALDSARAEKLDRLSTNAAPSLRNSQA